MNLYTDLPTFCDEEKGHIYVVIDIPKGSSNKYEYDEEGGYIALDRVVHHQMFYPFDYGFVPQTHALDDDATDVCLLTTYPTVPGCVVKARIIGGIDTRDESGSDLKIIAVPTSKIDPRFDEIETYSDLPAHVQKELELHFKEVKKLEVEKYDKVVINGFITPEEAMKTLKEAQARYAEKHS